MIKVVSPENMAAIEKKAYDEGNSEIDFMEAAGEGAAKVIHHYMERHNVQKHIVLLCGKGNNAGDAYVAGCRLIDLEYDVFALQMVPINECSELCRKNQECFARSGGLVHHVFSAEEIAFPLNGLIVDGLFGTGFRGAVEEPYASIIANANASGLPIISLDIPSGVNGETGAVETEAISADKTLYLGLPKTGCFLRDGWNHTGKLQYIDFGLPETAIEESEFFCEMLTLNGIKPLLPLVKRNRNKYEAGSVVGIAGSPGMSGAAMLSSHSTMVGGAGIIHLFHPKGMEAELSSSLQEVVKVPYSYNSAEAVVTAANKTQAVFVGPGLGRSKEAVAFCRELLPKIAVPCVIDADALWVLSQYDIALPKETILTPHKGEMERLLNCAPHQIVDEEFLKLCQEYAKKKKVTLLLKGGPTFIFHADGRRFVNPTGDAGMATAGSGDVLTGLVAALLAQGIVFEDAALLGVFLHGLAGEYAAQQKTSYCMIASDIIRHFPEAFRLCQS